MIKSPLIFYFFVLQHNCDYVIHNRVNNGYKVIFHPVLFVLSYLYTNEKEKGIQLFENFLKNLQKWVNLPNP